MSSAVNIPVIASGGAGAFDHFADVFTEGRADAALAASIFHFNEHSVEALKRVPHGRGIPVRGRGWHLTLVLHPATDATNLQPEP